jgi:predicted nucleic acid-binding protein
LGVVLDTSVLIALERGGQGVDFRRYRDYGDAFISAITVSELLVGIHYGDTEPGL